MTIDNMHWISFLIVSSVIILIVSTVIAVLLYKIISGILNYVWSIEWTKKK